MCCYDNKYPENRRGVVGINGIYGNCISAETSRAVRNSAVMAGVYSGYAKLSRLIFVFHQIRLEMFFLRF